MNSLIQGDDADPVLGREPVEDAGAATARWYAFQYATAVRYCLEMARPTSSVAWVLCEWHTDYVVGWQDNTCALVSVKYREPDSGAWTIARIFSDGDLAKFMTRWDECGRRSECRWVTNGGLDGDGRTLRDTCARRQPTKITDLAKELTSRFDRPKDDVAEFLTALRIDNDAPKVDHMRVLDIDRYSRQALMDLRLTVESAAEAYDAVAQLVRLASQGHGDCPGPWLLTAPGALDSNWLTQAAVARRIITRDQVVAAMRSAAPPAAASLPPLTQPVTRLIAKLKAGEVVPSTIAAARRARRAWTEYERGLSCPLPGGSIGPDFVGLRARLTAEAAEAQLKASRPDPYGNDMLTDMYQRIANVAREQMGSFGLNSRLLMGLVYDLTAHCEIWWSPEFELDEVTS